MSFAHFNQEDKEESKLYTLPGFKTFPENRIVSELSKKLFDEGREAVFDWSNNGQGFVVIAWKNSTDLDDILHIELVPAFNKGDKKPRSNKNDKPYIMYNPETMPELKKEEWENVAVESPEPLGQNSGAVHQYAIEVLKKSGRIPADLPKKNMFGLGVFKGNVQNKYLLSQFRNRSANINSESVKYNRLFELMEYDIQNQNDDYNIKRATDISLKICDALLSQLPAIKDIRECRDISIYAEKEKSWEKDNLYKINQLLKKLEEYILFSNNVENKFIEELLHYILRIQNKLKLESINIDATVLKAMSKSLYYAIERRSQDSIISQLITAGATPYDIDYSGFEIAHKIHLKRIMNQLFEYQDENFKSLNPEEKLAKLLIGGELFLPEIKSILEETPKPDIKKVSIEGKTPLMLAIMQNSNALGLLILEQYDEPDLSRDGTDLLFYAIKELMGSKLCYFY